MFFSETGHRNAPRSGIPRGIDGRGCRRCETRRCVAVCHGLISNPENVFEPYQTIIKIMLRGGDRRPEKAARDIRLVECVACAMASCVEVGRNTMAIQDKIVQTRETAHVLPPATLSATEEKQENGESRVSLPLSTRTNRASKFARKIIRKLTE